MTEFAAKGSALSSGGLDEASQAAGVGAPEIWSVLAAETSGCGFLSDRRPKLLFERHIFHRLTGGRFDAAVDVADAPNTATQTHLGVSDECRKEKRKGRPLMKLRP